MLTKAYGKPPRNLYQNRMKHPQRSLYDTRSTVYLIASMYGTFTYIYHKSGKLQVNLNIPCRMVWVFTITKKGIPLLKYPLVTTRLSVDPKQQKMAAYPPANTYIAGWGCPTFLDTKEYIDIPIFQPSMSVYNEKHLKHMCSTPNSRMSQVSAYPIFLEKYT